MNVRKVVAEFLKSRPEAKALYASGSAEGAIGNQGTLGEEIEFIAKPCSLENLANKVREVLNGRTPKVRVVAFNHVIRR